VNVQEYISTGIAESYVLGLASDEERREFEKMCEQYPEVLQARISFEFAMEKLAMDNAITPMPDTKNKLFEQINISKPASIQTATVRNLNWLKYAAAACLLLLAGSLYWNISLYSKNQQLKTDYDNTVAKLSGIEKEVQLITNNPNVKMASMKGMDVSPQSFATVYWDTTSHDVYLMLNNLPKPASDKQYQLWALLDGKPIDVGLIDNEYFIKESRLLIKAKNIQNAQAFAITLETKGGNPTPKGTMYVMGNL